MRAKLDLMTIRGNSLRPRLGAPLRARLEVLYEFAVLWVRALCFVLAEVVSVDPHLRRAALSWLPVWPLRCAGWSALAAEGSAGLWACGCRR